MPQPKTPLPYHGPVWRILDNDGNVKRREAMPDPVHQRFHQAVCDAAAGLIIPAAMEQMARVLADQLERVARSRNTADAWRSTR